MTLSLDTPSISSLSSVAGHQHPAEGAAHDRMREPKGYSGLPGPQPGRVVVGGVLTNSILTITWDARHHSVHLDRNIDRPRHHLEQMR